jgi:predicted transcriptional regulator
MDHITIDIPEGMDAAQKAELTQWLSMQAAQATPERMPFEDDPEWQAQTAARIKRGMQDAEAGRVISSTEARRRLDAKLGLTEPQ